MIEVLENFSSNETKIGQTKIVAFDSDLNEFKSIPKNDIIITETSQIKTTKARKLSQENNNEDLENYENLSLIDRCMTMDDDIDENLNFFQSNRINRSKTMLTGSLNKNMKENSILQSCNNLNFKNMNFDRFKTAKDEAERALKERKIFTIVGPYQSLRNALRKRGWVEKFENMGQTSSSLRSKHTSKKKAQPNSHSDVDNQLDASHIVDDNNDDTDDEEDDEKIKPWEENNGYYGILSRLVKNFNSNFIWTVKSSTLDYPYLTKDQLVNHYNKNGAFTTKIGLCSNLRNLSWHCSQNCDDFFPRCYKLCQEEDRNAFIDDYRITCCISLLKYFLIKYRNESEEDYLDVHITSAEELMKIQKDEEEKEKTSSSSSATPSETSPTKINPLSSIEPPSDQKPAQKNNQPTSKQSSRTSISSIPVNAIEFAIEQLDRFIDFRENNDLDKIEFNQVSEEKWQKFSEWFYAACHDKKPFQATSEQLNDEVIKCLEAVKNYWPQYAIDGFRNIWIVKPGALSRGRGIIVFDKLENILELNRSPLQRDGKYVVQKYIERPLLIHKIKFDIRQWFMVTDFNPLTIWMYKECYLRFCTQKFTLDSTQQSVHLCNYSIQKYYKNDSERSDELPKENMWSSNEFIEKYLAKTGRSRVWHDSIYPSMKNAILSAMLSSQDIVETRKNSFELYGADFMLSDDLKPWLLEINCSPTMAKSTEVTKILCDVVLEDVCKVILDRRTNRNADTGKFELIYKACPVTVPNYIGIDLKVDGFAYKKAQQQLSPQQSSNSSNTLAPKANIAPTTANAAIQLLSKQNPIETICVTSLNLKPVNNQVLNKPNAAATIPATTTTIALNPLHSLSVNRLRKETTLPAISFHASSTIATTSTNNLRETILKKRAQTNDAQSISSLVNLYKSIEDQTNYILNLNEIKKNNNNRRNTQPACLNDHKIEKNEKTNVRTTSLTNNNRVFAINEPKLFEFNHFNEPVNRIATNKPYLIKRGSISYQQFLKISKTSRNNDQNSKQNALSLKLNKKMKKQKNKNQKVINLSKLEVSDLNGFEFENSESQIAK